MGAPSVIATVSHLVIFLITISVVNSYRHKHFPKTLSYKKFSIEAQNKSKGSMMVMMKGKDGTPGEPGDQGDAGSKGSPGPPGPMGDKGPLGVCSKDQCESAELKALIVRLQALENLVNGAKNKTESPALLKCKANGSVAQNSSKQGGTVVIVCINPQAPAPVPTSQPAALKPTKPITKPAASVLPAPAPPAAPSGASPATLPAAPAPAGSPSAASPAPAPAPAPSAVPAAPSSLTMETSVQSPVVWETPPIPIQESTTVMMLPSKQTTPPQTVNSGAATYPATINRQQYYKRHEIPSKEDKMMIRHRRPRMHKGKLASHHRIIKSKQAKHMRN